jgi:hypothetical protein
MRATASFARASLALPSSGYRCMPLREAVQDERYAAASASRCPDGIPRGCSTTLILTVVGRDTSQTGFERLNRNRVPGLSFARLRLWGILWGVSDKFLVSSRHLCRG